MKFTLNLKHIIFGILAMVVVIGIYKTYAVKEIAVTAKQFSFSPNPIRLKLNQKVRFKVVSSDVAHGFSVPELGIDEVVTPGRETVIDFKPTKTGTFTLLCSVTCGAGHSGMRGQIIVE